MVDRISHLPDEILDGILSCLDLKQAVQTCVLSKRWRHVWRQIAKLTFNYDSVCHDGLKTSCFVNFVVNFVEGHRGRVTYFSFYGGTVPYYHDFLDKIICFAACNNPEFIEFSAFNVNPLIVPSCFHQSLNLRTFFICFFIPANTTTWIPFSHSSVRNLFLESRTLQRKLTGNIISDCPSLEHLSFWEFMLKDAHIAAPKLKSLEIWGCRRLSNRPHPSSVSKITLSTPGLMSLSLYNLIPEICLSAQVPAIETLEIIYTICLPGDEELSDEDEELSEEFGNKEIFLQNCINVLRKFPGVRSLTISVIIAELLLDAPADLFNHEGYLLPNVRQLRFATTEKHPFMFFNRDAKFIDRFIGNSSLLKSPEFVDVDLKERRDCRLVRFGGRRYD